MMPATELLPDRPMKVLVVEDEDDIADLIRFNLEKSGFIPHVLFEGRHMLHSVREFGPDLLVLDLMLPDSNGLDLCKRLRDDPDHAHLPVIMLTAKGTEGDRIQGLESGADDYIVKPFSPKELVLRIKAVLSRTYNGAPNGSPSTNGIIVKGPITLDLNRHTVLIKGEKTDLTATEYRLLRDLITHIGKVRSRETLLDKVWGYSFDGYARTVDTHIRRLRKKIGIASDLIETIRGIGYRFREES